MESGALKSPPARVCHVSSQEENLLKKDVQFSLMTIPHPLLWLC